MSASRHHRNMLALFGCCLFIQLVAAGVSYEASAPFFCEVNGKFHREGEQFTSASNPELTCQCRRGYTGRDVEPLCRPISRPVERPVEHDNVKEQSDSSSTDGCVRITSHSESPKYTHYTELYRCPNDAAVIPIIVTENLNHSRHERSICTFGDVRLGIRDYFYHSMTDDTRNCVKCTCERPPMPTCHRPSNCPVVRI